MLSSRDPSRIVPLPSPVSRPYDLLCFVLYGAQNQTLPETPPLAAPRITVVGSYATGLTMKVHSVCLAPKLTFVMFLAAGCSGPLPNTVPLPPARSSPPVSHHLLHLPEIQSGMENPHPQPIYTSSLTSPGAAGRLFFHSERRIFVSGNCCVVPGLAKHTSGRKPTF